MVGLDRGCGKQNALEARLSKDLCSGSMLRADQRAQATGPSHIQAGNNQTRGSDISISRRLECFALPPYHAAR